MGNKEAEEKGKEATLLQELCRSDSELYACLSTHLYLNPLVAVSPKDLTSLIEEAERSGRFRPALDKAILEGAQNPMDRERYIKAIQELASKGMRAMERERETALNGGLADLATSLGRGIEGLKLISERAEDVLSVASRFYGESLLTVGEDKRREKRLQAKRAAEGDEKRIEQMEKTAREARRQATRSLGRRERKAAGKADKREELAAAQRKEARGEERRAAEREEERIGEQEKAGREARTDDRRRK
jgi:hypothetical protein